MIPMSKDVKKQKISRKIKDFDELTITDDFMFGAVMSDPKRCKKLLEYILGIKITKIEYKEKQKTIDISYDSKGVRLDLTVIDDKGQVFDIEIQNGKNENLPLRIRYYHDMLDLDMLEKSMDYNKLNRCFVIFICTFDMFGKDRYMYTFKRQCQEDSSVFLGDEAVSIVLNTNGKVGEINSELRDALHYMAGQAPTGQFAKDLDDAVHKVKSDEKWRNGYMTYAVRLKESQLKGVKIGDYKRMVSDIRNGKGKGFDDFLIGILGISKDYFNEIAGMIDDYPDWTDEDIAYELVVGDNDK